MKIHCIVAVVACSLLSGCVTGPRLSEAGFPRNDADVDILATQQEIASGTSSTTGAGAASAGLLGMLIASSIDNTRNDRAEEAITPIRDHLIDYDMTEQFVDRILESRVTDRLVVASEPAVRQSVRPPEERELERPLIIIEPKVLLSNNMRTLLIDLHVWELEPGEGDDGPERGVGQSYRFMWPLERGERPDRDEAVALWLDRPREELIALIEKGMDQTVAMLDTHLQQTSLVFEDEDKRIEIREPGSFYLWRSHQDMHWIARKDGYGTIYAVPDHAID